MLFKSTVSVLGGATVFVGVGVGATMFAGFMDHYKVRPKAQNQPQDPVQRNRSLIKIYKLAGSKY